MTYYKPSSRFILTLAATALCGFAMPQTASAQTAASSSTMEESFARIQEQIMKQRANNVAAVTAVPPVSLTENIKVSSIDKNLTISPNPLVDEVKTKLYTNVQKTSDITPADIAARSGSTGSTIVGQEISKIERQHKALRGEVKALSDRYEQLTSKTASQSLAYHALVATMNSQLQAGTTPGNPRMVQKMSEAQNSLGSLSNNIAAINDLASDVSEAAAEASYLTESVNSAFMLHGATEKDHQNLAITEDKISNSLVVLERLLNNTSDSINRNSAYLASERNNLRTLSVAIDNGDLYGRSFANRMYQPVGLNVMPAAAPVSLAPAPVDMSPIGVTQSGAPLTPAPIAAAPTPAPEQPQALSGPRQLVKIRFTEDDVDFQQPVYMAVNEALARYPNAQFDVVGVHPSTGNAAQVAIESTRARRNADKVLRTLNDMGLDLNRVSTSFDKSEAANTSEVHIFVR